jgi:hypothetical protein
MNLKKSITLLNIVNLFIITFKIEPKSLLLSLPRVKGTIQNEHILLHPLIIETNATGLV